MMFRIIVFSCLLFSFVSADIIKERRSRPGDNASRYELHRNGDFFRIIGNVKFQITNQVTDFKIAHRNSVAVAYFVRNDSLHTLLFDYGNKAKKRQMLESILTKQDRYHYKVVQNAKSQVALLALNSESRLFIWNVQHNSTSVERIEEFKINPNFGTPGKPFSSYVAFARSFQGHVLKIKGNAQNVKWDHSTTYSSLRKFFERNQIGGKNSSPNPNPGPFSLKNANVGQLRRGGYLRIVAGDFSGFYLKDIDVWEVDYRSFKRKMGFQAVLRQGKLVGILGTYHRTDTSFLKRLCIPMGGGEDVWQLLYRDIKSIDGSEARNALIYLLNRLTMHVEKAFRPTIPTSAYDYKQAIKIRPSGYNIENLGSQQVNHRGFARVIDFKRMTRYGGKATIAFRATYKRTNTGFKKHFCLPTINTVDQQVRNNAYNAFKALNNAESQIDFAQILCKFVGYRIANRR